MKYSKLDRAYFRNSKKENSIKGGKLKENGILEKSDFSGKNGNNVVPKQKFKVEQNNMGFELQNMNSNKVGKYKQINVVKPIKIMKQKITDEPFFFFAYNPKTEKYHLVCYNNSKAKHGIEFKKLVIHENGPSEIVELSHTDFLDIGIQELIVLCYHFLKIRKQNHGFMDRLYKYLSDFVFKKVLGTRFPQNSNNHQIYRSMVGEIGQMVMNESRRMSNRGQQGGKLDVDGNLDNRDFDIESKKSNGSVHFEMNNMNNSNNIRLLSKKYQNQTVLPKEIIQKGLFSTGEPYIFFGYDPTIQKYRYVCYNSLLGNPVFRKLEDDKKTISQNLTLDQIKEIGNQTLLQLFCFLNRKTTNRGDGVRYMKRLQTYLLQDVGVKILDNKYC
jgi:hypothetical protein